MTQHKNEVSHASLLTAGSSNEGGFVLFTTLVIVIIVGILAVSGLRTTELTEVLSGNSIQRGRAIQAAEGGLIEAESVIEDSVGTRIYASTDADDGVFSRGAVEDLWWRTDAYAGSQAVEEDSYPGVVSVPVYVVEEIGDYESDGGSGITSLDRGGASYGSLSESGKEVVLYRLQSKGVGSTTSAQAIVESLYVQTQ